jgi:hypothetical protein
MWAMAAGFAASALAAAFFAVTRSFGLSRYSPGTALGCLMVDDPRHPFAETLGLAAHLILGSTLLAMLYALVVPRLGLPGWAGGALLGLAQGGAMIAMLSRAARLNRAVRAGRLPPPGRWGVEWGRYTALVAMAGAVLYGVVMGASLGASRSDSGANLALSSLVPHYHVVLPGQASLHGGGSC